MTEPEGWKETTDGMRRKPSASTTVPATPSRTAATTVFVVPRSMPTATAIVDKLHQTSAGRGPPARDPPRPLDDPCTARGGRGLVERVKGALLGLVLMSLSLVTATATTARA